MLILPSGHAEPVDQRPGVAVRERWMIRGVLTTVAVGIVVLVISLATSGPTSGHGCISVSLAYSTGGSQIYRCGAGAQALCNGVDRPGGVTGPPARTVAEACRKAGLVVR